MMSAATAGMIGGRGQSAPTYWGLTFTAEEAGSTVAMAKSGSAPAVSLETSTDGVNWTPFIVGTTTITLANVGDKVYFRAGDGGNGKNSRFSSSDNNVNNFTMSGRIAASGDVSSILDRSGTVLSFPSNVTHVLYGLFGGCGESLTSAPRLPSMALPGKSCYQYMFVGCKSLTTAPELPATALGQSSYFGMFMDCTSLTTVPAILPATTMFRDSYALMFRGCTSLTTAPEIFATTLAQTCFTQMFLGCTRLSYIKAHFTAWNSGSTTYCGSWVEGVGGSGTFICPSALPHTSSDFGKSKIPSGWAVETF